MKKLNKKKIVYLIILITIIIFLLSIYNSFNGNPISKIIAKGKLEKYIEETYPSRDFKIESVGYNFKFSNYYAKVLSEKDGLNFNIELMNNWIYDQYKELPILEDYELTKKFIDTIETYTREDLQGVVSFESGNGKEVNDKYLSVKIEIPQGKYRDKDIEFSNDMDDPFVIEVNLYPEYESEYKEELIKVTKALKKSVNNRMYNGIIGIIVNIGWDNESHCIVINRDELSISDHELEKYIKEGYATYKGAYGNYEIGISNYSK